MVVSMSIFGNPSKDAKKIHDAIDYRVLKAAWNSYAQINISSLTRTHKVATPAWFALFSIQNYEGNFNKFSVEELHLLQAIKNVHLAYDEIIKALEAHSGDEDLARHILNTHPNLRHAIPPQYDNVAKINGYIVTVIKQYEKLLAEFYKKYQKQIDKTVERLTILESKGVEQPKG